MVPGAIGLEVKVTCVCGHVFDCEVFVMDDVDRGQAPICCAKCHRYLLVQRISPPRIQILADPRKPEDEMIEVRGPSDEPDEPKVH